MSETIDLLPFCGNSSDPREYLRTPFSFGHYTFATNGYVIARVPRRAGVVDVPPTVGEEVERIFSDVKGPFIAVPHHVQPARKRCTVCRGYGKISICPECDGDGEVTVGNRFHDYDVGCKTCRGDGTIAHPDGDRCDTCGGDGRAYDLYGNIFVGSARVSIRNLTLISRLPAPEIQLREDRENYSTIPFRFAGGDGGVMPLRY